jgi:hypothetical protein
MSSESCPHCDLTLRDADTAYCSHCGRPLDETVPSRDRSDRLRRIPRAPDVRASGWGASKWGLLAGIGFGIASSIGRLQEKVGRDQSTDVAYVVGGAIGGALIGYLIGLLIEKVF